MQKPIWILLILIIIPSLILAQGHDVDHAEHAEHLELQEHGDVHETPPPHRVGVGGGYTYVPEGAEDATEDEGIFVPTLSLEYFYDVHPDWSVGVMIDLELDTYVIPSRGDFIERNKALVVGFVALYEFTHDWCVYYGGGFELEKHHNFAVFKLGTTYEIALGNEWDISPCLNFDYKGEYASWSLLFTFGKRF